MGKFEEDSSETEKKENSILARLYEQSSIMKKLDFNINFLNNYLVKSLNSYLMARYSQDLSICEKYLSKECLKELSIDIKNQVSVFTNPIINFISIDIISQDLQSVNFVSDLMLEIEVKVYYKKHNIYTGISTDNEEHFKQKIWYIFSEVGWIINKYFPRDFL